MPRITKAEIEKEMAKVSKRQRKAAFKAWETRRATAAEAEREAKRRARLRKARKAEREALAA